MKNQIRLTIIIIFISTTFLNAQDSYIKDRWNIKLGYQSIQSLAEKIHSPYLSLNYGIHNNLECGISSWYTFSSSNGITSNQSINTLANVNFHILPFIFKESKEFRFDFYLNGNVGLAMIFFNIQGYNNTAYSELFGIGAGLSFYLLDNFGVFAEYNYGKYYFTNNLFRYGLSIKF